jgi:hypothetical protein
MELLSFVVLGGLEMEGGLKIWEETQRVGPQKTGAIFTLLGDGMLARFCFLFVEAAGMGSS